MMCGTSKPTRKLTSAGRPSLYTPSLGLKLITAMATGLSLEAAAAKIGVGARTLFSWQNQHEEFRQAIQEGRQRALLFWEEQAISMAKGAPGNAQLVMLALKNRSRAASGWHDAQRLEAVCGRPARHSAEAPVGMRGGWRLVAVERRQGKRRGKS